MHRSLHADIAAFLDPQYAGPAVTADGSPDTTPAVDRVDADSACLCLGFTATLAADETLIVNGVTIEESDDGSAFDPAEDLELGDLLAATGASGGSTETGSVKVPVNLEGRKRFYRLAFTGNLSGGGSATLVPAIVHGGSRELPVGAG